MQTHILPVWVTGVLGGMGPFDVPLEWTGPLLPVRDVAIPVFFAANREERSPGAYHNDVTVRPTNSPTRIPLSVRSRTSRRARSA